MHIGIQMQAQRVVQAAPVGVLLQEPCQLRVVESGFQVVQPRFVVELVPGGMLLRVHAGY